MTAAEPISPEIEKATSLLAERTVELSGIDAEIAEVTAELDRLDALDELSQKDLLLEENARRTLRRLDASRANAAAAATAARVAVAAAQREQDRVCFHEAQRQIVSLTADLGDTVLRAEDSIREKVADLQLAVAEAKRLASASGEVLSERGALWLGVNPPPFNDRNRAVGADVFFQWLAQTCHSAGGNHISNPRDPGMLRYVAPADQK